MNNKVNKPLVLGAPKALLLGALFALAACSDRGTIEFAEPDDTATVHNIWVINQRSSLPIQEGQSSPPRTADMSFNKFEISVPPTHASGEIEWPDGDPDAQTNFAAISTDELPDLRSFVRAISASDDTGMNETVLFVHGYNVTHGEAVYQLAQVVHDFEVPSPSVLFSWPSAGKAIGYVYDRDSALFARDQLEDVLVGLTRGTNRKVVIVGHSMGNLLIMETLRQVAIKGTIDIERQIAGVVMISPDIDGDLFQAQTRSITTWPDPFIIVGAEQDVALRVSALLTGRQSRLGSSVDGSVVGDLPITVINVSEFGQGGLDHSVGLSSPAAIAIAKRANQANLPSEMQNSTLLVLADR